MIVTYEKTIYPKTGLIDGQYGVAIYKPQQPLKSKSMGILTRFTATGYCLPHGTLQYELKGRWEKTKYGPQFSVETFREVIEPTEAGIIGFLASGQIKGVGKSLAQRIYDKFGNQTLTVLDKHPEALLQVKGISEKKFKTIHDSYLASRGARDVIAFLAPHGIGVRFALKLYNEYKEHTLETVSQHPYQLVEIAGISFKTADRIAVSMGFDLCSPERIDQCLLFTLADAESVGNLCMEKHAFIKSALELLNTPELTERIVADRAHILVKSGKITCFDGMAYRTSTAHAEEDVTARLLFLNSATPSKCVSNISEAIQEESRRQKMNFDEDQRAAIGVALACPITIITGGPGTGKTSIQRAIISIFRRAFPDGNVLCCAPTGRAARRMEQATGYPASTVHKALGLSDRDEPGKSLDADLILVDEVSMLDIFVARRLFEAVLRGSLLVLIGDADQLPSVGPGAVLSEMIASEQFAVMRLEKVHRQKGQSRIALNAQKIRLGNVSLDYGPDFQFIDSANIEESAEICTRCYLDAVAEYGIDNVLMLSPYRKKTETGVIAMNRRLQALVNPAAPSKVETAFGKQLFRDGDLVMQTRNTEDASNGDIGKIVSIKTIDDAEYITVDFFDGRIIDYEHSELGLLDLAYACTIHKSQGSEAKCVIINLQNAQYPMLLRPLIYTAITRAKDKVVIVGERKALCIAINRLSTESRGTKLAKRLKEGDAL